MVTKEYLLQNAAQAERDAATALANYHRLDAVAKFARMAAERMDAPKPVEAEQPRAKRGRKPRANGRVVEPPAAEGPESLANV